MNSSISSHADIEKLSMFPEEREVLFFPFSSFEIKNIKEVHNNNIDYEIELLYLGKYLKEFKKDKKLIEKENIIPDSEFKKQIVQFGLIKQENVEKSKNIRQLINKYEQYKDNINKKKEEKTDIKKLNKICEINIQKKIKNKNERNNTELSKKNNDNNKEIKNEKILNSTGINENKNKEINKEEKKINRMSNLINIFEKNKNKEIKKDNNNNVQINKIQKNNIDKFENRIKDNINNKKDINNINQTEKQLEINESNNKNNEQKKNDKTRFDKDKNNEQKKNDKTRFDKDKNNEQKDESMEKINEINSYIENFTNNEINLNEEYNNIIYYNDNINDLYSFDKECEYFENSNSGTVIVCIDMEELTLIREEILKQSNYYPFSLILGEVNFEKINKFLNENEKFYCCILNICIYCKNPEKYDKNKLGNNRIFGIYKDKEKVINYIKDFSSIKLKPYPITELITYQKYLHKYKDKHYLISKYYGDLSEDTFKKKYNNIYHLIKNDFDRKDIFDLLDSFSLFKCGPSTGTDNDIIQEFTKTGNFHSFINKNLISPMNNNSYDIVAYFASRIMYSLNSYAQKNDKYCLINEKKLYRGIKVSFATLLRYKRAKGKIIVFPSFSSSSEEEKIANMWLEFSSNDSNRCFSVLFIIKNYYKNNIIPNAIDIQDISVYPGEKEYVFLPFSFYYFKDIKIDLEKKRADIFLETIGKREILENQIKKGKEIEYNERERI